MALGIKGHKLPTRAFVYTCGGMPFHFNGT